MNRVLEFVDEAVIAMNKTPRVLVVESETETLVLIANVLNQYGCNVLSATTGEMFRTIIDTETSAGRDRLISLLFLDLNVTDIDIVETLRFLKVKLAGVPVILIADSPDSECLNKAAKVGYFGLLMKPLDVAHLNEIFAAHKIRKADGPVLLPGPSEVKA